MMKIFSFRAPEEIMKEAEKLAELERIDKSILIREALEKGFERIRIDIAIKLFSEGKIATAEASDIANLSVGELMQIFRERGIGSRISLDELQGSLENAMKAIK